MSLDDAVPDETAPLDDPRTLDEKLLDTFAAAAGVVDAMGLAPVGTDGLPFVHIAGLNLSVGGVVTRQRCAWCGTMLIEHTRHPGASVLLGADGQPLSDMAPWPVGGLVRVDADGTGSFLPGQPGGLPADFCGYLDQRLAAATSPAPAPG